MKCPSFPLSRWRVYRQSLTKVFILCVLLFGVITFFNIFHTDSSSVTSDFQRQISEAPLHELRKIYESTHRHLLDDQGYNPAENARRLGAPEKLPSGQYAFDLSPEAYVERLQTFVQRYLPKAQPSLLAEIQRSLDGVTAHTSASRKDLPHQIWSTHPNGTEGVHEYFHLWNKLLPRPLSPALTRYLEELPSNLRNLAEEGTAWTTRVATDDDMDRLMSAWTGETLARENVKAGDEKFSTLWGTLPFGVLRSDLFRYMALLMKGGIYADADTAPIAHPYMWGITSRSVLDPRVEVMMTRLREASPAAHKLDAQPLDYSSQYDPPQLPDQRRLVPMQGDPMHSILDPGVSVVVALEWDRAIAFDPRRIFQWSGWRIWRAWWKSCYARNLQVGQYLMMAKPFHPIMLDTIATISELVESNPDLQGVGALDLTGPGPFTDSVLRYILVQYGVTPSDLSNLKQSARVGDVIFLHEGSFMVSNDPFKKFLKHLEAIVSNSAKAADEIQDVWYHGIGYDSWKSGGIVVARHELQGLWKGKGW